MPDPWHDREARAPAARWQDRRHRIDTAKPAVCPGLYRQAATVEKVLLKLVPTTLNAAIAPTAINAAINAYSMAVTPDSFLIRFMRVRNRILLDMG